MAKRKNLYKVEFSVDNLSMKEQEQFYKIILAQLDFEQRQNLHIKITDFIGGEHFLWEGYGIDPFGEKCNNCKFIDCETCAIYKNRKEKKDGKNSNDVRTNREDK